MQHARKRRQGRALATDPGALPTGTGGVALDGIYYLTGFTAYAGSVLRPGLVLRQTLSLCGSIGDLVNDEAGETKRKTLTFKPSGVAPNLTQTCASKAGDAEIPYSSYTANATTLTFYSTASTFSATYTKQ